MHFYEHGIPKRVLIDGHWVWRRTDTFHTDQCPDLDGQKDTLSCVDGQDQSPIQKDDDSRCACCWLNIPHTWRYHFQRIDMYQLATEAHHVQKENR